MKDFIIKKLYAYIIANIILISLSIVTIAGSIGGGDKGLVGEFGLSFANANVNVFGYFAYIYLLLALYPAYRLYKDCSFSLRRLELIISTTLLCIALLILQALVFDKGIFGIAIVNLLKSYIGLFGVWVLDIFIIFFSWLVATKQNLERLAKKYTLKFLVLCDLLKFTTLKAYSYIYKKSLQLKNAIQALYRYASHRLALKNRADSIIDLQNEDLSHTKAPLYDFKDLEISEQLDEQSMQKAMDLKQKLSESKIQAYNQAILNQNIASSKYYSDISNAIDSLLSLKAIKKSQVLESTQNSKDSSLESSSAESSESLVDNENLASKDLTSDEPKKSLIRLVKSSGKTDIQAFLKQQQETHRHLLEQFNLLPKQDSNLESKLDSQQELQDSKDTQDLKQDSQENITTQIQVPPPRELNKSAFMKVSPNIGIIKANQKAATSANNAEFSTFNKEIYMPFDSSAYKNLSQNNDDLQTQIPQFSPIKPLTHTAKQEVQIKDLKESSKEVKPESTQDSKQDAPILKTPTQDSINLQDLKPKDSTQPAQQTQSTQQPQQKLFEFKIEEIVDKPTQSIKESKSNWIDEIITEIPSSNAPQQTTQQNNAPQQSHAISQDIQPKAKHYEIVSELDENVALLDSLEYGKIPQTSGNFKLPPTSLLNKPLDSKIEIDEDEIDRKIERLLTKLKIFKIDGDVIRTYSGPLVTTFEFRPALSVKVSRILSLEDDLALELQAISVRIQAPVPGKDVVGIEIPNSKIQTIYLREILESEVFKNSISTLTLALGKDIVGSPFITDLKKLPHLLIAGTTGSGKSVGINAMILSLLYKNTPQNLKLLMIDPKKVEFSIYADIPHLITPIITNAKKAIVGLNSAAAEMDRRYELMQEMQARDIDVYNKKIALEGGEKMPYFVIIIDELADLMMTGGKEIEFAISRIASMGRASGMHIIAATQRPSVDVVTGIIKTNMPSRISYKVGSKIDSKVILDKFGAESLIGRGDMLFTPPGVDGLTRLHAPWNTEEEIERITSFIKSQQGPNYDKNFMLDEQLDDSMRGGESSGEDGDLLSQAKAIMIRTGKTSGSYLQRELGIGYNKAAKIVEQLEKDGFLSTPNTRGIREILHS